MGSVKVFLTVLLWGQVTFTPKIRWRIIEELSFPELAGKSKITLNKPYTFLHVLTQFCVAFVDCHNPVLSKPVVASHYSYPVHPGIKGKGMSSCCSRTMAPSWGRGNTEKASSHCFLAA